MMIIEFYGHHSIDEGSHFEILQYAVNSDGLIVQKEYSQGAVGFAIPKEEAFTPNLPKVVGLAQFANRTANRTGKMLYTFDQITPELVSSLIFGPITNQHFTIVADELGNRGCWSRGIKNIYFV